MPTYRYLAVDPSSGDVLDELPLTGVQFTHTLNGTGACRASLRLPARDEGGRYVPITRPGRSAVFIERDGRLVYGGLVWTRSWDSSSLALSLDLSDYGSYLARRSIRETLTYTQVDQAQVARALVERHSGAAAGIPITLPPTTLLHGKKRDVTWEAHARRSVLEALQQFAQREGGFEFAFDALYDPQGRPTVELVLGHPQLGRQAATTDLVLDLRERYEWPEDASQVASTVDALGAGQGEGVLIRTAQNANLLNLGYPVLDAVVSFTDVTSADELAAQARAAAAQLSAPVTTPAITVTGDELDLLAYRAGDYLRVLLDDPRWPEVESRVLRIVERQVSPPSERAGEAVALTLAEVTTL